MVTRYSKFGVVINPQTEEKVNWLDLNLEDVEKKLKDLSFKTGRQLEDILLNLNIQGRKIAKTDDHGNCKVADYIGQLEQGEGGTPHYQLWLEVKPQVTKRALLKALSRDIYGCDESKAISVQILTNDDTEYKQYCMKEESRLKLSKEQDASVISMGSRTYFNYLEENPEIKKYMTLQDYISNTFLNLYLNVDEEEK